MAESLYVGIMTDTGNFAYSILDADLFRAVAVLIDRGINVPHIYSAVYNNFSEGRMRLLGYVLNDKMKLLWEHGTAYVGLTEEEMRRFNFKQGDSEGFVNYPLSIRGINLSAMFIETHRDIRVSLRSRGDVDVNVFAPLLRRRRPPQRCGGQVFRHDGGDDPPLRTLGARILRRTSPARDGQRRHGQRKPLSGRVKHKPRKLSGNEWPGKSPIRR